MRPRTERSARKHGSLTCRTLLILALFASAAMSGPAYAGPEPDLVYTWHEDDGAAIHGFLAARQSAQDAGRIDFGDVTAFSFTTPLGSFSLANLQTDGFPIAISPGNGAFTGSPLHQISALSGIQQNIALLHVGVGLEDPPLFNSMNVTTLSARIDGQGHWTVSNMSSVPEIATLGLALIGMMATACVWAARLVQEHGRARSPSTSA
jgi:hypothetical protein